MKSNSTPHRTLSLLATSTFLMVAVFVMMPTAHAAFLPGTIALANGTTVFPPLIAAPSGSILQASQIAPYSFSTTAGTTSGTLNSAVYLNASGTLDFYYQVANNASSSTAIARESNTNFDSFATQVGYFLNGASLGTPVFANGTIAPVTADRNSSGSVIGYSFNPPESAKVVPGTTSAVLVVSTLATRFVPGNAEVIDGGTQTVASFQPATAPNVPEPASFALIGGGLVALAGIRRFRRQS